MKKAIVLTVLYLWSADSLGAACGPVYGADGLAVDRDGGIWITHYEDVRLARLSPETGRFEEYLPEKKANPFVLARDTWSKEHGFDYGYDFGFQGIAVDETRGLVWSVRYNSDKVARFSRKDRVFTEITLPGRSFDRFDLPLDREGNLWVITGAGADKFHDGQLVKVRPDGGTETFQLPVSEFIAPALETGNDGQIWIGINFSQDERPKLYVFEDGRFESVKVPEELGPYIKRLHWDDRESLWLTAGNDIWRLHEGKFTRYAVPSPNASPSVIASDAQGNLWFTQWFGNKIGRIDRDGEIREYPLPPEEESPRALVVDPNGKVWFSVAFNYDLFQLDPATGKIRQFPVPVPSNWSKNVAEGLAACVVKPKDALTEKDTAKVDAGQSVATEQMVHDAPVRHPLGYPKDRGAVAFEKACQTACHTWYRVDKVAARRSDWGPTVDRMIEFNKAAIDKKQRDLIVKYLNRHYTMKKRGGG